MALRVTTMNKNSIFELNWLRVNGWQSNCGIPRAYIKEKNQWNP
jgi:hypothetical protein